MLEPTPKTSIFFYAAGGSGREQQRQAEDQPGRVDRQLCADDRPHGDLLRICAAGGALRAGDVGGDGAALCGAQCERKLLRSLHY